MALDSAFWNDERELLLQFVLPFLRQSALNGAENGTRSLLELAGVGVDWGLVNVDVHEWTLRYGFDLVSGITETTRTFLQDAVGIWETSGQPLDALIESLKPTFGQVRAEMIASTEVTRAYASGNQIAWQQSGVVDAMVWKTAVDERVCPICGPLHDTELPLTSTEIPPAHPRCRCWVQPKVTLP